MKSIVKIEAERQVLQQRCDTEKTQRERNQLGQFSTPFELALEIVRFAKGFFPIEEKVRFLDPAFGTGSFFSALLQVFDTGRVERSVGFEIDCHYAGRTAKLWNGNNLELRNTDFTRAIAPAGQDGFNLVICNPPYVRHHHLSATEKSRLHGLARSISGMPLSGLAGLYCYFLLLCHAWVSQGGLCVWLIPSEFMDVNYGVQLKDYLLTKVTLLQVHRFSAEDVQFGDALVSSSVVCFRKALPQKDHTVNFSFGGNLTNPNKLQSMLLSGLRADSKWNDASSHSRNAAGAKLCDFFDVKRGLATGDNRFFILTPEQVRSNQLPKRFLRPILPSPRYLTELEVHSDLDGNPLVERKLFLLDCRLSEAEVRRNYPRLAKYLESGSDVAKGYLCRSRSPWYLQENRPAPLLLCTYMGRRRTKTGPAFRFILNHSKATAANVYLLLYPKSGLNQALREKPELARMIWHWLNDLLPTVMVGEGRVYGGGLHKIEPKELGNIPADGILHLLGGSFKTPPEQLQFFTRRNDSLLAYG